MNFEDKTELLFPKGIGVALHIIIDNLILKIKIIS